MGADDGTVESGKGDEIESALSLHESSRSCEDILSSKMVSVSKVTQIRTTRDIKAG